MKMNSRIYIAGHKGMVGSAIIRALTAQGYLNIITVSKKEVDLRISEQVERFFKSEQPDYVFLAAAKVGGIYANLTYPADFLYDNLMIQNNIIRYSYENGVKKLLFLGSSCIYPRDCPQPMKEEYLLTGPLEPTNEGYALAKIAGLRLAQFYHQQHGLKSICPMPCNLYGTNDSFDPQKSHVLSALVKKFVDAVKLDLAKVVLWGSGAARREFMHVDDLANALLFLMEYYDSPTIINVGWGMDVSIKELANLIAKQAGYKGEIHWDLNMPDGMPRKCLDISTIYSLGFKPKISLEEGIDQVINEYYAHCENGEEKL